MSQEVDRSKPLQGSSLTVQRAGASGVHRATRAAVAAYARNLEAAGELAVSEFSDALIVSLVPNLDYASGTTRASVRKDAAQSRLTRKFVVGDLR